MKLYDDSEQATRQEKLNALRYGDQLEHGWVFLAMNERATEFFAVPDAYFFSGAGFGAVTRIATSSTSSQPSERRIRQVDVALWLEKGIPKTEAKRPSDCTGAGWLPVSNHKEAA